MRAHAQKNRLKTLLETWAQSTPWPFLHIVHVWLLMPDIATDHIVFKFTFMQGLYLGALELRHKHDSI